MTVILKFRSYPRVTEDPGSFSNQIDWLMSKFKILLYSQLKFKMSNNIQIIFHVPV